MKMRISDLAKVMTFSQVNNIVVREVRDEGFTVEEIRNIDLFIPIPHGGMYHHDDAWVKEEFEIYHLLNRIVLRVIPLYDPKLNITSVIIDVAERNAK